MKNHLVNSRNLNTIVYFVLVVTKSVVKDAIWLYAFESDSPEIKMEIFSQNILIQDYN
jgi:hypothetical protein